MREALAVTAIISIADGVAGSLFVRGGRVNSAHVDVAVHQNKANTGRTDTSSFPMTRRTAGFCPQAAQGGGESLGCRLCGCRGCGLGLPRAQLTLFARDSAVKWHAPHAASMPHPLPPVRYVLGKLVGHVTSTAQIKTAVVSIPRFYRHPKYNVDSKRRTKIWAHDEFELCAVGDKVRIEPSRALSKRKAHVVVEILQKEDGSEPPRPFPSF